MWGEVFHWEKISGVCQGICYALGINFWFLLCNFPVLSFLLFVGAGQAGTYLPLLLVCLLPMGPALAAVFYSMNRLLSGTETRSFRDFWGGLRESGIKALKLGAGQLLLIFILWTNLRFFTAVRPFVPVAVVTAILFLLVVLTTPGLYFLAVFCDMGWLKTVKMALAMTVGKPAATLGSAAAFLLLLAGFEIFPGGVVLFMASVYGFLVVYMNRRLLRD